MESFLLWDVCFFFQAEDGIRDLTVTGVRTCALPIWWIRVAIDVGAVLGIGSVILVMLLGQSRVFYSMSRDGLLGRWAGQPHPRFRTPYLSTIYTGIAVCLATAVLQLQLLATWANIGTLLAFWLLCAGVSILRHQRPQLHR